MNGQRDKTSAAYAKLATRAYGLLEAITKHGMGKVDCLNATQHDVTKMLAVTYGLERVAETLGINNERLND